MQIENRQCDEYGNRKYILKTQGNALVEATTFYHNHMEHFCIPSQIGCALGCLHCATTYAPNPYIGQISYPEMVMMVECLLGDSNYSGERVLSFSGHGEPMLNWDCVESTLYHFSNEFAAFHLTSIGILDTMDHILKGFCRPTIYFSMHGSCNSERDRIINPGKKGLSADIEQIVAFGKAYNRVGGKSIWNYMVHAENSSLVSAQRLIDLCKSVDYPLEIRFTKYNDIYQENGIREVHKEEIENFMQLISGCAGQNVQFRFSQLEGTTANMACGQLRASMIK